MNFEAINADLFELDNTVDLDDATLTDLSTVAAFEQDWMAR